MRRRDFIKALGAGIASSSFVSGFASAENSSPPNVILLMADDLGAENLSCYQSQSHLTPKLDQMARNGMRFDSAYTTPSCTPSRVQIMSGLYPHRTGWTDNIANRVEGNAHLDRNTKTFGHLFKAHNYRTAVVGKWQLAKFHQFPDHPSEMGFDEYCLWTWVKDGERKLRYWEPHMYINGQYYEGAAQEYGPNLCYDYISSFMQHNQKNPFFLYYPMLLPHYEFVPTPFACHLAKDQRWLAHVDKSGLSSGMKKNEKAKVFFPRMMDYMDYLVGRIVDRVAELGLERNTLIIFTSDNGTSAHVQSTISGKVIAGGKRKLFERGCRVPFIAQWKGVVPENKVTDELVDSTDFVSTFADILGGTKGVIDPQGKSFLNVLKNRGGSKRQTILSEFRKHRVLRNKGYMLHSKSRFYDLTKKRYVEEDIYGKENRTQKYARLELEDTMARLPPVGHNKFRWKK